MRTYIVCSYCDRSIAVNADGRVRKHGTCNGSGKSKDGFPISPKTEYEAMKATKDAQNAESKLTTFNDGKFIRTAIVANDQSSIDVLNAKGERIGQINIFAIEDRDILMVDVIDVENRYTVRRGITFPEGGSPKHVEAGKLVAAHFENPVPAAVPVPEDVAEVAFDTELTPSADTSEDGDADDLAELEAEFAALGGRDVELADRIDALRKRLEDE